MYLHMIFLQHAFIALCETINPPIGGVRRLGPIGIVITDLEISHVNTSRRRFVSLYNLVRLMKPD